MAKQSRYSIEIKDETGKTFTFTADWTVDQRRLAVPQIRRRTDVERGTSPTRAQHASRPSFGCPTEPPSREHIKPGSKGHALVAGNYGRFPRRSNHSVAPTSKPNTSADPTFGGWPT